MNCDFGQQTVRNFVVHMQLHSTENNTCTGCYFKHSIKPNLMIKKEHSVKQLLCMYCDFGRQTVANFVVHMQLHSTEMILAVDVISNKQLKHISHYTWNMYIKNYFIFHIDK